MRRAIQQYQFGKLSVCRLFIFLAILFLPCLSFAETTITTSASPATAAAGSTVSVSVSVNTGITFNSAQFSLQFDQKLLTFVSATVDSNNNPSWTILNNPNVPGQVTVGMFNTGGSALSVTGTNKRIAVLTFMVNSNSTDSSTTLGLSPAYLDSTSLTSGQVIPGTFTLQAAQVNYNLTVNKSGSGTVAQSPAGPSYPAGTVVTVTPTPGSGYQFFNWTGDISSTANPLVFTINAATTIMANFTQITENLTVSAGANGTISPTGTVSVNYGASQAFTLTPSAGYTPSLTVDGTTVALTGNAYTLSSITSAHTIAATFTQQTETITASAGANGSISPAGAVSVGYGTSKVFTVTPSTGYNASILVDGVAASLSGNTYTFSNVTGNHTIAASFSQQTVAVTATAGANGTISPSGTVNVNYGAGQLFTLTPSAGYTPSLTVDGTTVTLTGNTYTLTNVTTAHTIAASFTLQNETITASAGANGTISPSGAVSVGYGTSKVFTVTPSTGYNASILVDGVAASLSGNTYTFSNVTGNHTIAASFSLQTVAVTASAGANGTISPSGTVNVNYGAGQLFTLTPSAGYTPSLTVDGTTVTLTGNTYTLTNVTTTHTVAASFTLQNETITASAGANGTMSPSGAVTVGYGTSKVFTVTPSTGYNASILVDGVAASLSGNTYTFSNVTGNHTIAASFSQQTVAVTASAGANGTISPSGTVNVNYGAGQVFTLTPSAGYTPSLTVDGTTVTLTGNTYTLTNVTAPHTVAASFTLQTETITASAGANGTISPTGAVSVNYGTGKTFTVTSSTGYNASILVDGVTATLTGNTYAFTNVTGNHTIAASFTLQTETITASAGANGSISPAGAVSINYGTSKTFTITPNTGYNASILVDGVTASMTSGTYTFSNVTGNHTITASFTLQGASTDGTFINASTGGNLINGDGVWTFSTTTSAGGNLILLNGNSTGGYGVLLLAYNGGQIYVETSTGTWYVWSGSWNSFGYDPRTPPQIITASTGLGGSISPSGAVSVPWGTSKTFTVTPNTGYNASLTVDGQPAALTANAYTFTNVTTPHTIVVSFSLQTEALTVTSGANGTISPSGTVTVNYGASQAFTLTPSAGYTPGLTVDGTAVTLTGNTYTLTNVTTAHTIAASFTLQTETITASAGANGAISPSGASTVGYGTSKTFTITPSTGYNASILVDGSAASLTGNTYTFTNVTGNHTIIASFSLQTVAVTATAGANGSISPSGTVNVNYGASQLFTLTPSAGYTPSLTVDGTTVTLTGNTYTLMNVTAQHTVTASFTLQTEALTITTTSGGSISPVGTINVNYGSSQTFNLTPTTGFTPSLTIDGTTVTLTGNTYTLSNITTPHAIAANFTLQTETITASAGTNGSISPTGAVSVNYGTSKTFTITPSTGYNASLLVDGTAASLSGNTYTFTNVTGNHTITASFTLQGASTDGAVITPASGGNLINGDGVWTFSTTTSAGGNLLLLNGNSTSGYGVLLLAYNGGQIYTETATGAWYVWSGGWNSFGYDPRTPPQTITASAGTGGSISPSGAVSVAWGTSKTFTVAPNTGYNASLTVDGQPASLTANAYTFTNVTTPHTIAVSFSLQTEALTVTSGANGTISPSGTVNVNYGTSQAFTLTPSAGYTPSLTIDGTAVTLTGNAYTLTNITAPHTIAASFTLQTETITASAGANGAISPSGAVSVNYGTSRTFTVTPSTGYNPVLTVDGSPAALTGNTYTFTNVTGNHTIAVSFSLQTEAVTVSAGNGGSINPTGTINVNYGSNQIFTLTPGAGYTPSLTVDGTTVTLSGNTYTLMNVTAPHTVTASFTLQTEALTITTTSGGSISPVGTVSVNYGSSQTFNLTPTTGFTPSLTIDGTTVTLAGNAYTLNNITTPHTIAANFTLQTETITASAGTNGTISPTGAVSVGYGTSKTFTITPSTGYNASISVDGAGASLSGNTYTFTNVTGNHTITASFTLQGASTDGAVITPASGGNLINGDGVWTFSTTTSAGGNLLLLNGNSTSGYGVLLLAYNGGQIYTETATGAWYVWSGGWNSFGYDPRTPPQTITASAGTGGSISPSGAVSVAWGTSKTFTVAPNTGYNASLTVDGQPASLTANAYTFTNVTTPHTIAVSFSLQTEALTVSAGTGGTISPTGTVNVNYGTSQLFTLTPSTGYNASLTVDGATVTLSNNTYTLTNITTTHNIAATFILQSESIIASAGQGGTVTPASATVNYGTASPIFTFTPSTGYVISQLLVDGVAQTFDPAGATYSFSNVTANHNLSASFTLQKETLTVTAGSNGTISPSGSVSVNYGSSQLFTVTPNAGYTPVLTVDGTQVQLVNNLYTLSNITGSHAVAVSFTQQTETITATAGSNGTISPLGATTVAYGTSQTFTVTPTAGYSALLTVDGQSASLTNNTYTFNNVTTNHTIAVTFSLQTEALTITGGSNGTISPTGTVNVNYGSNQTFTLTPAAGYTAILNIDGTPVTLTNNTYTLSDITSAHTIAASFSQQVETITATAGSNGSISPSGAVSVTYGGSQVFTITANDGYTPALLVDGAPVNFFRGNFVKSQATSQSQTLTYTFSNVTANHTISVSFSNQTVTVTASAGSNGTISPSGSVTVAYGASQLFTLTPASGYAAILTVDGTPVTLTNNTYTLTNVTAAHTLVASFNSQTVTVTATAGANGTISPSGSVSVAYGGNQTFTLTPSTGYIPSLTLDGQVVTLTNNAYTLTNVTAAHALAASFNVSGLAPDGTILDAGSGGSITTAAGTWSFSSTTGGGGNLILLNGQSAGGGAGTELLVDNGGHVYTLIKAGTWWIWASGWSALGGDPEVAPTVPTSLTATAASPTQVSVSWGASTSANGITGYTIFRNGAQVGTSTATSYSDTGLSASTTYSYTVYASDRAFANSVPTAPVSVTTQAQAALSPDGTTITAASGGSLLTSAGTWTLSTTTVSGNNLILLNGKSASGYGVLLLVYNSGKIYAETNSNTWWLWNGGWAASSDPRPSGQPDVITATAGANGTIAPSGAVNVQPGANQIFTITPNAGYMPSLTVDGQPATLTGNTYTFSGVTTNHTIAVTFTLQTETINASAGSNGSISPSGNVSVNYGASQTFTVTPNSGYNASLLVDGAAVSLTGNTYTFSSVTANHTIAASFTQQSQQTVIVTATAGANGSISPSGAVHVQVGASQTFTLSPSTGYTASLTVDGSLVTLTNDTYTLTNVTTAHTVAASFTLQQQQTETITATAGSNGSISPAGVITVNEGDNETFTVTPNSGYNAALIVDGVAVSLTGNTYTFTNVTTNHTIAASFTLQNLTLLATASVGGTISPSGSVVVAYGSSQTFTLTPNAGYTASLTIDGLPVTLTGTNTYTLTNVTLAHAVAASFSLNGVSADGTTLNAGTGGSLLNAQGTWTINASNGVLLNGSSAGGGYATTLLVYNQGHIYGKSTGWWLWNGSGWAGVAGDPRTPPTTPTGLAATAVSSTQVNLSWNYSTSNILIAGYKIFRNGTQVATATGQTYSDTGVSATTTYSYMIQAVDTENVTSAQTTAVSVTTPQHMDISPDGSTLSSGSSGNLVTLDGTWTFSGTSVLLNGKSAGGGSAVTLVVDNGGKVYAQSANNSWWLWTSGGWAASTDPL